MEAKWLPPEEANSPMVASLFLRNMQPNISDPCCLQFQQGNYIMVQLYQGAQEIQKRFDWKGTPAVRYNRRRKNPETHAGTVGKVAMTKITAPSFAIFAIATPMAPEIVDLRYRNQRRQGGQNGNGGLRPAPGCKALTPVLEDSEEYQSTGPPEHDEKGVGDTPEAEEEAPKASMGPTGTILQPEPVQEQASFAGQPKQEQVAAEVDRVHEIIFRQIKDAKISLTIDEITTLSPSEPPRAELGASSTSGATPSEGSPVGIKAVRTCYVPPMILVRIGDITFPRVLVDTGFRVSVMSNQIRIRLGYHRMAPPTTKLAMADNTLVWPLGVLSADLVVVEGVRLKVSFQVTEMENRSTPS
ncbi:hypothetical protein R1flu_002452 [Riccia fluitans]|uniref:Uncharacterized protein n=1 Tax=Riccia fluitans TaxID=41844 RepID=A0ABD1Y9H7_9MARC